MEYIKPEIEMLEFNHEDIYTDHIYVSGTTTGGIEEPGTDVGGDDWWQD